MAAVAFLVWLSTSWGTQPNYEVLGMGKTAKQVLALRIKIQIPHMSLGTIIWLVEACMTLRSILAKKNQM